MIICPNCNKMAAHVRFACYECFNEWQSAMYVTKKEVISLTDTEIKMSIKYWVKKKKLIKESINVWSKE